MMPPRRAETSGDPTLITGLLGAAALLDELLALLGELAGDGDHSPPGAEPARDGMFDEVVDAMLGLAALARTAARHLPDRLRRAGDAAAPPPAARPAPAARELLR
jgi:hypothetical protein